MSNLKDLQALLEREGIRSVQEAMRHKDLARLGDPLANLLFSFAYSLHLSRFVGQKVSGKTLAAALRFAQLRHLAPSRLDAHELGDCVEAMIAYGWIRGFFTISEAAILIQEQILTVNYGNKLTKATFTEIVAKGFSVLLQVIWEKEQNIV